MTGGSINTEEIFYDVPIPIIVFDQNRKIIRVNKEADDVFISLKMTYEEDCNRIFDMINEVLVAFKRDGKKDGSIKKKIKMRNGHLFIEIKLKQVVDNHAPMENTIVVLNFLNYDNRARRHHGVEHNNSRNMEVEKALRQKIKELERIFETLPGLNIRVNKNFKIMDCKLGPCGGFPAIGEDCIGSFIEEILPDPIKLQFLEDIDHVFRTSDVLEREYCIEKNDLYRYSEVRMLLLSEEEILILIRDVTARKNMEMALKKSEEKYRMIFDASPDYIYMMDDQCQLIDANPAFLNRLGIDKEGIQNINIKNIDVDKKEGPGALKKLLQGEKLVEIKTVCRDMKGNLFHVEVNTTPLAREGKIKRILCYARDVSEKIKILQMKKEAKENLRRLNEALEYKNLRTEFFANISHEFRTPVNVILGTLQLMNLYLDRITEKEDQEKFYRFNKVMKQNCFRLIRLVNNLIDITKIDSGYFKLDIVNWDIVKLVEAIALSVRDYANQKSVEIFFKSTVESQVLACDPDMIERILLNLLSNAIKFTDPLDKIFVTLTKDDDHMFISVKDTGMGVKEENLGIIFERFRQVNKSFTRNNEGSGIGLSLVKSLVEMHGGNIMVRSRIGEGSEFIIKLPISVVEEENWNSVYLDDFDHNRVENVHVEFSDIYL